MATGTVQSGIDLHEMQGIAHTPESWARFIIASALESASSQSGFGNEPISIPCTIRVDPSAVPASAETRGIGICIDIAGHIGCVGLYTPH